jgi:hypothetical protein
MLAAKATENPLSRPISASVSRIAASSSTISR